MNFYSTPGVSSLPENFTKPSKKYIKHVWLAVGSIMLFVLIYFALTFWFAYSSYLMFLNSFNSNSYNVGYFLLGVGLLLLAIFMIKSLFIKIKKEKIQDVEVSKEEEPELYGFINNLADEAKAPRPHKIFLSPRVNASVFYELSFINLFFPSKKNLEIGLGLVNVLNLGEFKSVLAHEFGHFAQKSMLVGRWVYIAYQIANLIISKRDALDKFLRGLSYSDIRIAWTGWILSIIIWSIRSVTETLFRIVDLAQRSLSREMEFQADKVSVSLCGSDAIVHALHKMNAADNAFSNALNIVDEQLKNKKAVSDIFELQKNAIEKTAQILNDKSYGASLKVPEFEPEKNRIFKLQYYLPPQMWATHPSDNDREENAKKIYIIAPIDERSTWLLFKDPEKRKLQQTERIIKSTKIETNPVPIDESIKIQNLQYEQIYFQPRYRGIYLNRSILKNYKSHLDLLDENLNNDNVNNFDAIYPESLSNEMQNLKSLTEEKNVFKAILNKEVKTERGMIIYRGKKLSKNDLPEVIDTIESELNVVINKIELHDRYCHSLFYNAARNLNFGWDDYLKNLLHVIHYTEHTSTDLIDVQGKLINVFAVVTADGRVTESEMETLLNAANQVHKALTNIHIQKAILLPNNKLLSQMHVEKWSDLFENFDLPHANNGNINNFLNVINSWIDEAVNALNKLRSSALTELLTTEDYIYDCIKNNNKINDTHPGLCILPESYSLLLPGSERKLQTKLSTWDRFYTADGFLPTIARLSVAAAIILLTVFLTGTINTSEIKIYNGLSQTVKVKIGDTENILDPHSNLNINLKNDRDFEIRTSTYDGEYIESFKPELHRGSVTYVYNVANSAELYNWTVFYGGIPYENSVNIGTTRWFISEADYFFTDPPESIETHGESTTREVLTAYSNGSPDNFVYMVENPVDYKSIVLSHATWDDANSKYLAQWFNYALPYDEFKTVLDKRLTRNPKEILSLRYKTDYSNKAEKDSICKEFSSLSKSNPNDPDYYYLSCRCIENNEEQDKAFLEGFKKWPEHPWLGYVMANRYIENEEWKNAYDLFSLVFDKEPVIEGMMEIILERIRRMMNDQVMIISNGGNETCEYIKYINSLEEGKDPEIMETPAHAYYLISEGRLNDAVEKAEGTSLYPEILRLAAASYNADYNLIKKVQELDSTEGLNQNTIYYSLALHQKMYKNIDAMKEPLKMILNEYADTTVHYIYKINEGKFTEAENLLKDFNIITIAQHYAMGLIILGDKAPEKWFTYAKNILFINEKPYIVYKNKKI